jgi:hypothetical protein
MGSDISMLPDMDPNNSMLADTGSDISTVYCDITT